LKPDDGEVDVADDPNQAVPGVDFRSLPALLVQWLKHIKHFGRRGFIRCVDVVAKTRPARKAGSEIAFRIS